jgi:hypothetical protein
MGPNLILISALIFRLFLEELLDLEIQGWTPAFGRRNLMGHQGLTE